MAARYWITFLVLSVLPAPDSPLFTVNIRMKGTVEDLRDEDTLVLPFLTHVNPCAFCDREYVRRVLILAFATVLLDYGFRIERK